MVRRVNRDEGVMDDETLIPKLLTCMCFGLFGLFD